MLLRLVNSRVVGAQFYHLSPVDAVQYSTISLIYGAITRHFK